jgi:hypothetical protein
MSIFTTVTPSYAEVLEVRAGRVAMVRDFLATGHVGGAGRDAPEPLDPECPETTLACLHVILNEEWEHHRYAVRDLDAIEAKSDASCDARSSARAECDSRHIATRTGARNAPTMERDLRPQELKEAHESG